MAGSKPYSLSSRRRSSPPRTRSRSVTEPYSSPLSRSKTTVTEPNFSPPRTPSVSLPEHISSSHNSSPLNRSRAMPEPLSSPLNRSRATPEPNSSTQTRSGALPDLNSSPQTRSGATPDPNSSPQTRSLALPEHISSPPRTRRKPNSSPESNGMPRTPFSIGAITPLTGTLKSISLTEWWLKKKTNTKTNKNSLCIGGLEYKDGYERRQFSSAPISIRHDSVTLETADGIRVSIDGDIDRAHSEHFGVSYATCNRFFTGFPYNWRDYEEDGFAEEEEEKEKKLFGDCDDVNVYDDLMEKAPAWLNEKLLGDAFASLRNLVCPDDDDDDDDDDDGGDASLRDLVCPNAKKSDKECDVVASLGDLVCRNTKKSDNDVDVDGSLRDLVCPNVEKSDKECNVGVVCLKAKKSDKECNDDDVVVGVKTRGMKRRSEEDEASSSIGKRVHKISEKKMKKKK